MADNEQLDKNDKSLLELSFPSYAAVHWAEDIIVDAMFARSFKDDLTPGYVIKTILRNVQYEEKLPDNSERISKLCKRLLHSGSQTLLDESTIDLANFMLRHLEYDLHNEAAHRFFARKTFPMYLKLRGIYILKEDQRSSLLRTVFYTLPNAQNSNRLDFNTKEALINKAVMQNNMAETIAKLKFFESMLAQGEIPSVSSYNPVLKGIIAHMPIPVSLMEELSKDKSFIVQQCLAYNPLTPDSVLDKLWRNNDETTILNVVSNKNASFETLQEIVQEIPHSPATKHILLSIDDLATFNTVFDEHLNSDPEKRSWNVLKGFAGSHHISYDQIVSLMESGLMTDLELVYNFLANPVIDSVWKELLKGMLDDKLYIHI